MRSLLLILISLVLGQFLIAQGGQDPVLFTVEGKPVNVSEFDYIYSKNSGKNTDYSEASLQEYLDLYVKFKLKVQRAKELQLDTIPTLMKELDGYRKQLAKSYLTDKEVTNRLIDEVYNRSKNDVSVSHILINLPQNANDQKVSQAYDQINAIYKELKSGMDFESAVKKYSQDKISSQNKGTLGYLTSMFPAGFYELENTAYSLKVGEVSKPIRTKLGLHIVRLDDKRTARGEMEISHILIREKSQRKVTTDPKGKIDSLYIRLNAGEEFAALARSYSEDKSSSKNGGYIGFFGINRFEKAFENAAFSLTNDNTYSKPFKTSVGWHIIKRISVKEAPSYEDSKKRLKALVIKDPRQKIATASLIDRIKTESYFVEDMEVLNKFASAMDKTFFSYKWKAPAMEEKALFSFGENKYSLSDFAEYAKSNTRTRLRMDELPANEAVLKMYKDYVEDQAIVYEEKQLEEKYPDFKAIMREYEEGILLFEVTKMNVWDKASQDTVGLNKFYENHKNDYMWKERANMKNYVLKTTDEKIIKKFSKRARKKSPEWLKNKFGDIFTVTEGIYERGSRDASGVKFSKNSVSSPIVDERKGTVKFKKVDSLIAPAMKSLSEARGYIEADYQDQLEKEWVAKLKQKYSVNIDESVLKSLIK